MAQLQAFEQVLQNPSNGAYFKMVQNRKKLPMSLQEAINYAFANISVSTFPMVPGGKVIEIQANASVGEAIKILSEANILAAPVCESNDVNTVDWRERYLGIIDFSAIVLWVLESADIASAAMSASCAAAAGVGAGAAGALGALAAGATGPVAVAGLAAAAVGAALAGGLAADQGVGKDASSAADTLGDDFYKVILEDEPFASTTVRSIITSYRWAPFIPVAADSSMLGVLLLLSKYRLRNVPVIESGKPTIKNFITQSAVVKGLENCQGRDWFDRIAAQPISEVGLPFMCTDEVISINSSELVLEAFKLMKDNQIGGLPVTEGPEKNIIGSLSIKDIRFLLLNRELFTKYRELVVKDFMDTIASEAHDSEKDVIPITCSLSSNIGNVIHILASKMVHRVYVVGANGKEVVGVITLRDVISCFIFEPPNYFENYLGLTRQKVKN
ncbi:SNF1-related protein kinase regulatory subunit gamma-1-like [Heracleum sosnowskyi]|uniref:SNF1-related protein kinase regulatory subunit gamma-1-like n=1 Tax=Heracleum sosnowskyi TaxID=360622 RepID=A0AAD8H9Q8_9APIA|nr:SNF1-related protein kinase regulatory subunit gamma-1-like [Heracleum sosnowskyi]